MINQSINPVFKGLMYQLLWFLFFANAFACFVRIPARTVVDVSSGIFLGILVIHYGLTNIYFQNQKLYLYN